MDRASCGRSAPAPRRRPITHCPGRARARDPGPRQPATAARPGRSGHCGARWPGRDLLSRRGLGRRADRRHRRRRGRADSAPSHRGPRSGRPRPGRPPHTPPHPHRPALRGDGTRLPTTRATRPPDDVQYRGPADLPRRRRGRSDRSALARPARSRSGAGRAVRQLAAAPAATPAGRRRGPRPPSAPMPRSPSRHRSTATRLPRGPGWRWRRRCCASAAATAGMRPAD